VKAVLVRKTDKMGAVVKALDKLTRRDVLVGVPGDTADRDQDEYGPMNNPTLAYIHDNGSPAQNIPARPFMAPGIEAVKERIASGLGKAASAALDDRDDLAMRHLERVGLAAQSSIRRYISTGNFAPLAAATLRARAARGRKGALLELASRAAGNAPSNESARPLIDSGQLRNSLTYVVR
jgi:hypothetical protein